jgi:hypothetical protein
MYMRMFSRICPLTQYLESRLPTKHSAAADKLTGERVHSPPPPPPRNSAGDKENLLFLLSVMTVAAGHAFEAAAERAPMTH